MIENKVFTLEELQNQNSEKPSQADIETFESLIIYEDEPSVSTGEIITLEELQKQEQQDTAIEQPEVEEVEVEEEEERTNIEETGIDKVKRYQAAIEKLKSDFQKMQPGQDKYDEGMRIKRLEDNLSDYKSKIFQGSPDYDNSLSLVDQDAETIVNIFQQKNIPVRMTGDDTIEYIDPNTKESKKIVLSPYGGYDAKVKVANQIDTLKKSFEDLNAKESLMYSASTIGQFQSGNSMNNALSGTPYEVKEVTRPGSAVLFYEGTKDYVVFKDGQPVTKRLNKNDLQIYFNENLNKQDVDIIGQNLSQASAKFADLKKDRREQEKQKINNVESAKEFLQSGDFGKLIEIQFNKANSGFTTQEADLVKKYINSFDSRRPTTTVTEKEIGGGTISRQVPLDLSDADYVVARISELVEFKGLPDNLRAKLLQNKTTLENVFRQGLLNYKRQKLDDRMVTISEQLTKDSGNQDLLKLSYKFNENEKEQYKENLIKLQELQGDYVDLLSNNNVKPLLQKISKEAPEGTTINIPNITEQGPDGTIISSDFVYEIKRPDRKLTKEEEERFKEAQSDLYLLYENQKNLQKNYELDVQKTLQDIQRYEEKVKGRKISQQELFNVAFKEYGLGKVLANDFNTAVGGLALSIPTLFGSEWATQQQRKINERQKAFETPLSYDQAYEQGRLGSFLLRTTTQQAPNILLAIGTAGAGNALGLSRMASQLMVGSTFGVSSGADKFRNLKLGEELVDVAKNQKQQIQAAYDLGKIDDATYNQSMLEANKTIAMNDLTPEQILGASIATGIIEGTVTSFIGTAPNSLKVIKDFSKVGQSLKDLVYKKNLKEIIASGAKEFGKRVGGEAIEEEVIYFGDQLISEGLILGKDMDFSQWDDVAVASFITAGTMNGPGIVYSSVMTNSASKKFQEDVESVIKENEGLSKIIQDSEASPEAKKVAVAALADNMKQLNGLTSELEVDAIALGAENQKKLIQFNIIENSILEEAGVKPTDSQDVKREKIQLYQDKLANEGNKNKAQDFRDKLKAIEDEKAKILKDVDYNRVDEALGEKGKLVSDRLKRYNKGGYRTKNKKQQLAQVIQEIRNEVVQDNIIKAKSNPAVVLQVESMRNSKGKPYSERFKNQIYAKQGELMVAQQGRALSLDRNISDNAADIIPNIKNLKIQEFNNIEEADDILTKKVESGDMTNEQKYKILESLEEDANAFIVDDQYIVRDKKLAEERLLEGKLLPATAIMHEINHAIDDKVFANDKERSDYAENIYKHTQSNPKLKAISDGVIQQLYQIYPENIDKKFDETTDEFKDEYTKRLQETLYALNDQLKLEKKEGTKDKIEAFIGRNLKTNTPQKAFDYMISNNAAFRQGKISKKTQKRLAKSAAEAKKGIKLSPNIDLTKVSNQDKLNDLVGPTNEKGFYTVSKEDFKGSQAENAVKLLLQTGSFDNLIGKKILVTDPKQRQEILERSKDEIEKHVARFDPTKNKSLFGYINSYIQDKVGTAAKAVLREPKTVPTSRKIGGEDSKVTVAETLVSDEISPEEYADMKLAQDKLKKIKPQQSKIANKINLTDNEINLAKRDIIGFLRKTDRPSMTDPKKFFKAFVDYTTGSGVQPGGFAKVIYDKLSLPKDGRLSTKNREAFIKDIAEDLIALNKVDPAVMRRSNWKGLFYDVEIKNMSPSQTQKAIDEGRVPSTTNLSSGLDLFKTLDPSVDQVVDYLMKIRPDVFKRKMPKFLGEVIVKNEFNEILDNPVQPIYDAKGNKTDNTIDLSKSITEEEVVRGAPQVREKIARPEGVKFSKNLKALEKQNQKNQQPVKIKIHDAIREVAGQLDHVDPKSVEKIKRFIVDILAPIMKGDVYNFIRSQDLSPIGNRGEKKIGLEFFLESIVPRSKDQDVIGFNQTLVEENILGTLSDLRNELSEAGIEEGDQVTILSEIFKKQELNDLNENLENLDERKKATKELLKKFKKSYKNDKSGLPVLKELFYNPNASRMWGKNVALLRSIFEGVTNKAKYEEHTYQFGNWSRRSLQAIKSNDKIFNGWLDWAAENYYQTAFDSKFKTPITRNVKIGPTTKSETRDLTYQEAVDKTYIKDGIVWEAKAQEHPLLRKQLDEAFKTGDFSKVPASEIRFFNEFFTLNPFKLTLDGQTFAEKYNLKVPKNLQDNIDVYQKAGELIYKKILTNAGILTGAEAMTDTNAQSQLNAEIKLADNKQKSKIATEKELNNSVAKFSKTMSTEDVIGYAKTLDDALANARKLDAPVKKIRVFDFDDTLAQTKSLVFYNKPSDTKTVKPKLKAIVMAGPPGGGKSSIIKGLGLVNDGFKEVNQDISLEWLKTKEGLPAKESDYTKEQKSMRSKLGAQARKIAARKLDKFAAQGNGIILDGTGASVAATEAKIQALEELGYEVSMIYVNTPKEIAIARNKARKERSLPNFIVEKTWDAVNANRDVYAGRFGDKFYEVNTEGLKQGEVPRKVSDAIRNDLAAEERGRLTAEEFAKQGKDLVDQGFVMDFSDFNIVREGERGPLFEVAKKIKEARGNEDLFVLTARAPESQDAIYEFLKSEGLEFKRENIIGLGNSTGAAKANWIVNKAAEGYNDFYFADDAYNNVQAVQDALDQIDVKSQVQQAKVKFSKNVDEDFNKIIEKTTGIASEKRYSKAKAKVRGANKGNFKFFIPYSAEDFTGLIYPLLSKGKEGDNQMAWFKTNLLDPYARAIENLSSDRIQMMDDFRQLKKSLEVPKDLRKKNESGFTNEQAVRVYLFNKMGYDVPGLSKTDLSELVDIVNSDGKLKAFADQILTLTKGDGYVKPAQEWLAGTITTDLIDLLNSTKRAKYLEQSGYLDNVKAIFSEENLNKLEAAYGSKYREALENILSRMKSGKNRLFSGNKLTNQVLDYINGSIGTIMFFNTRSAVLQTISAVNFLNWSFNNPYKAGKAFANQAQYWKDFKMLMNSDYLTDRRNGLKLNISENEIANAAATSKNKARGVLNYILQKGYLPTQIADSFAIASGGATFYRNRVNDLVSQGMDIKEAENQALSEWKETAEISQQSSDPSKISQQQASNLGRIILAFANTPMQYARLQKRAIQDLINGRGDAKTHVSKLIYYGVVQNLIFNALQQALFGLAFGDDEDDEKKDKQYHNVANGMLDSTLRGLGIGGATISVIKNFLLDIYERSGRKRPEYVDAVYKLLQISPPISSKISKIRQAAYQFDSKKRREEIFEKGFSIDNPAYEASAKVISAVTNAPVDRLFNKINNIEAALSEEAETWQTIALLAGWPEWQIMTNQPKKQEEMPKYPGNKIKKPKVRTIPKKVRRIQKVRRVR